MGRTPTGETRRKVFEFVRDRLLAGQPPTIREVQDAFGFRAVQTARQHLERLVEDGRLVAGRHKARGYRLPGAAREPRIVLVPMLGRVPAGALDEAIEDPDGYLPVDARGASAGDLFALRVRGESMTGVGILPGDLVIVRRQPGRCERRHRSGVGRERRDGQDLPYARAASGNSVRRTRRSIRSCSTPRLSAILGKVIEVRRILGVRGAAGA